MKISTLQTRKGMPMTGKVINQLDEIRREREAREGMKITWERVASDTGMAYSTVLRWAKGQINRYDDEALAKFCEYFNVQPGDILKYESEDT